MKVITKSEEDTIKLGEKIGKRLKAGDIVALCGDLGAGKTTLVKGIAKGLGVKDYCRVNSPSFVIVKEYKGKVPLFHFDIYRLDTLKAIEDIGYEEYLGRGGVVAIEWSNKMSRILPKGHIGVALKISGPEKRTVTVRERQNA